ncbi:Yippee family protein [Penicillium digitatum PHI26]|uniref:Yippee family protein n=2 Tax=Penicillium digitatum TaxID=36651 RepID=K9GF80_PEND2|nr:Yippee family protein [Penicillium digitatum Pd1]EKV11156.1 Yippee family protein [Penicillium digitatum Pd1]EKV11906.1 Yippee family protein [Penicillium digitatum PHI26]
MQEFLDKDSQSTVLATCYSVEPSTSKVHGFHYCTTPGAGVQCPPYDMIDSRAERTWPGIRPEYKGEATHNIPEECERLFCDRLSATFLGERNSAGQESLGMDAFQNIQSNQIGHRNDRIKRWTEVWDYSSDAIYRGFVAEHNKERTLFVFFEDRAVEHGLKSGVLGWKYVAAEEESQRYKVGKFILETKKIAASSCWESPSGVDQTMQADLQNEIKSGPADTEFDSQDEDECEDLFAGIWSPGLAARRRNRDIKRRTAMWGIS